MTISSISVAGSLIVRPFLPDVEDNSAVCDDDEVASYDNVTDNMLNTTETDGDIPNLAWPFLIISLVHLLTGVGYCCISNTN